MVLNWKIKLESYFSISLHHCSTKFGKEQKANTYFKGTMLKTDFVSGKSLTIKEKGKLEGEFAMITTEAGQEHVAPL